MNHMNYNKSEAGECEKIQHVDDIHAGDKLVTCFEKFCTVSPHQPKLKNKNDYLKQKQKGHAVVSFEVDSRQCLKRCISRRTCSRNLRRNTMDCALLNEMFVNVDVSDASKRVDKRIEVSQRNAEKELKNSLASVSSSSVILRDYNLDKNRTNKCLSPENDIETQRRYQRSKVVESCNRYMSVSSRPIGCRSSAPAQAFIVPRSSIISNPALKLRKDFHETFANLIKLGSVDRQDMKLSLDEHTWQTEIKDLIWLELQAWRADRTPEQQDKYLFAERQNVAELLTQIINYKYEPKYLRQIGDLSIDSGLELESHLNINTHCAGCLSLYCKDCIDQQDLAMKEVEELLTRLESAEALYPSSQAMGAFHPIYKSDQFENRIKTMCLWYNITKQMRLKLTILGKILTRLQGERVSWPTQTSIVNNDTSSGNSSISGFENEDNNYSNINSSKISKKKITCPRVKFLLSDSIDKPGDTTSSNESNCDEIINEFDSFYNKTKNKIANDGNSLHDFKKSIFEFSCALYRKFIENVLKSRGLANSLAFLYKLHNVVMYKAHISLEKTGIESYDLERIDDDVAHLEHVINVEQIDELKRYGYWSEEYKSINLPTYIPIFVFLSGVPLQFMHEFLRMRLETRPMKPNPLSLQQLMKELREGLTLALTHRQRYHRHITTALTENEEELERFLGILNDYDTTVRQAFELYLEYTDQLIFTAVLENNQKIALEREWMFTKLISPMITGMHILASQKFCIIVRNLLKSISDRLVNRAKQLDMKIEDTANNIPTEYKWQILTVCREIQTLLSTERECCVKLLFFTKSFCRDVESADFHREHHVDLDIKCDNNSTIDYVCNEIKESFKLLQHDILDVRNKLIQIIQRVQERCSLKHIKDLEEQDRQAVLSRTREILHQGFKFGFEYHKDVIRLFEHRINKNHGCEKDLALGIIIFAKMWMQFVMERCERGRGMRPRWASQGLEFLIFACDPQITYYLNDEEFEELKKKIDCCISHVIGLTSETERVTRKRASPRSRKNSSPVPSRSRTPCRTPNIPNISVNNNTTLLSPTTHTHIYKFLCPQFSEKEQFLLQRSGSTDSIDGNMNRSHANEYDPILKSDLNLLVPTNLRVKTNIMSVTESTTNPSLERSDSLALRQVRIRDAINRLDMELDDKLHDRNLIGHVRTLNCAEKVQIRSRSVNFRWHRGIKIGQGRFGKVYTAVNNQTGELMAMKEIAMYPGESRVLQNVAEELKILEGIKHENLVRYYGIEVHREELLIFMELCSEGTLESLVELLGGLPEGLIRRFTSQLLSGIEELHKHGIVHRDIKTANIFLIAGGNSLKLGDFGSAVKIQAHTTIPGELQGYVGTQAYMAPEVFTKTNSDGHGRAADIWSVGCVVIEMSSGKRPWAQFDSNFQIMFKVGMGEKPQTPDSLSQEGHDFVNHCLQYDSRDRQTALELLQHNFCKYGRDDDFNAEQLAK